MELAGKITIKATLEDDIRRISIHNEELTYDELILMMQRIFRGKLSATDDIIMKYADEDGDLITLFDNGDLAHAVEYSKVLKLTLFVNGKTNVYPFSAEKSRSIKGELREIRDKVNALLDVMDDLTEPEKGPESEKEDKIAVVEAPKKEALNGFQSKEFDPLQTSPATTTPSNDFVPEHKPKSTGGPTPAPTPPPPAAAAAYVMPQQMAPSNRYVAPLQQGQDPPPTSHYNAHMRPQQTITSGYNPAQQPRPISAATVSAGVTRPHMMYQPYPAGSMPPGNPAASSMPPVGTVNSAPHYPTSVSMNPGTPTSWPQQQPTLAGPAYQPQTLPYPYPKPMQNQQPPLYR